MGDALVAPLILVLGLLAFDLAALTWGVDSRDRPDSSEWERRHHWPGGGAV